MPINLSLHHAAVDERISKDKTLVEKKIPSRFKLLIVEPLQELEKEVKPEEVPIDRLDAQLIASSVEVNSTLFG